MVNRQFMACSEIGLLFQALEINQETGVPQFQFKKKNINNYFKIPDETYLLSFEGDDARMAKLSPQEMYQKAKKIAKLDKFIRERPPKKVILLPIYALPIDTERYNYILPIGS